MEKESIIKFFYEKYRNLIENSLFVIILAFYPLIRINQGLDVSDTAYSLVNFQYFPSADGTWQTATYLANAAGYLFMQLPKGDTLLGMNFYTGLIVSFLLYHAEKNAGMDCFYGRNAGCGSVLVSYGHLI